MASFKKALFRYQREAGSDGWSAHVDEAIAYVNRKPLPYGRGTMGQSASEIDQSYEDGGLFGGEEAVGGFFGNTELSLVLSTVIYCISGVED